MMKKPVINCAVCQRPVDSILTSFEDNSACYIFTVFCHGESDTCKLTNHFIQEAHGPLVGIAFDRKKLEA